MRAEIAEMRNYVQPESQRVARQLEAFGYEILLRIMKVSKNARYSAK